MKPQSQPSLPGYLTRFRLSVGLFFSLLGGVSSAAWAAGGPVGFDQIIPKPLTVVPSNGTFLIDKTVMLLSPGTAGADEADLFGRLLFEKTGIALARRGKAPRTIKAEIDFNLPDSLGAEGYVINCTPTELRVRSTTGNGLLLGLTSVAQAASIGLIGAKAELKCGDVADKPRFAYRGMHLDVCRHFYTVEEVKKYIDHLAYYKFNTFHWHLTDDQGWRIEILKYPRLTTVGSKRAQTLIGHIRNTAKTYDGKPVSGFYTQEQIRDVVRYATARHITVMPEIEMPGHAQAAIAAYKWLGSNTDSVKVWDAWGYSPYIFNPNERTMGFLRDVLTEVAGLFPSEFIHIGGDEAAKQHWKANAEVQTQIKILGLKDEEALQGWMLTEIEKHLATLGKRMMGWDEIGSTGVSPTAAIMVWHNGNKSLNILQAGHESVLSPGSHCYFDSYQADPRTVSQPLAIGGLTTLKTVYAFDPIPPGLTPEQQGKVLGIQGNLWTEYIASFPKVQYMIFPRMLALAEVAWCPYGTKNYAAFKPRATLAFADLKRSGAQIGPVGE